MTVLDSRPDLQQALAPLTGRRSANAIGPVGPDDDALTAVLSAASTAPDHGALRPYRFVVARGAGLVALGDALVSAAREADPALPDAVRDKIAAKAQVAPVMVVLVASPVPGHKVAPWEQRATAHCAGFGLVLAADLAGWGAVWKTAPVLHGSALTALLDLAPEEQVLGWVNVGQRLVSPPPRRAVAAGEVASRLDGARTTPWEGPASVPVPPTA